MESTEYRLGAGCTEKISVRCRVQRKGCRVRKGTGPVQGIGGAEGTGCAVQPGLGTVTVRVEGAEYMVQGAESRFAVRRV